MIDQLVTLLVLVLILGLVWWIFTSIVPLPEPFMKIAMVIIAVIFILAILGIFFGGYHFPLLRR
jgi:heme A synthase